MSRSRPTTALLMLVSLLLALAACTEAEDPAAGDEGATADPAEDAATDQAATEEATADAGSEAAGDMPTGPVSGLLIYPETGPVAAVAGATIDAGSQAVNQMWNEEHPDRQLELQTCNDEGNPERGISCYERYAAESDVVIGPHFGSVFAAVQPLVQEGSLLVTATPHARPDPSTPIFQAIATPEMAMQAAIDYMQEQGWEQFGMLTSSDTTGNSALESAQEVADEQGIELVVEQFDPESQDLTAQVSAIADQDVPGLFIWSSGAQVVTALRGVENVGLDVPVFLNYSSMSRSVIDLAGDAVPEELLFTGSTAFDTSAIDDPDRAARVEEFSALYEEITGDPPDWVAFAIADAAWVALTAAEHGDDPAAMVEWLESGEEIPAFHAVYQYGPDDHIGLPESPIEVLRWTGDQFQLID